MSFRTFAYALTATTILCSPAMAQDATRPELKARVEGNLRAGTERSIAMTEFWVPLAQDSKSVIYGDARIMGDDKENNEFNLGVGYREIVTDVPVLGNGVAGVHGWVDRRHTERGSTFNQITAGAEWYGDVVDIKANAYIPLSGEKTYGAGVGASAPYLAGSGIFYNVSNFSVVEEPQPGLDLELGFNVSGLVDGFTDSTRVYAGAYHFSGDKSDDVTGWRTRIASDVTQDVQIGARFQRDDERGSQGFLEATIRFPFGNKQSFKRSGLYARLDESPERDIDIVTGATKPSAAGAAIEVRPVLNATSGDAQRVLYVDNSAAGGGTGALDSPFNTLAAAQAALADNDVIYIARGNGTTTNMDAGFNFNRAGVSLIGEGAVFVYDGGKFTAGGTNFSGVTLKAPGLAPILTNTAGHGVTVTSNNAFMAGFTIDGAAGNGILIDANNIDTQNITIRSIAAINNDRHGIYLHGYNNGSLSTMIERSITTGNAQHGFAVYDDTANLFEVDMGGGVMGSSGNNVLAANTLEDLALDYDGRTIAAMNNWWGQASGPDQDAPNVGIRPQIYYGAPINDGLMAHYTFDNEWVNGATAYDRSGNGNDATLYGGVTDANLTTGLRRQALSFDGMNDYAMAANIDLSSTAAVTAFMSRYKSDFVPLTMDIEFSPNFNSSATGFGIFPNDTTGCAGKIASSIRGNAGYNIKCYARPSANAWHEYANVFNKAQNAANENTLYIDGVPATFINQTHALNNTNNFGVNNLYMMSRGGTSLYEAELLDEVRIYDRAFTADEVAESQRMDTSSVVNSGGFLTAAP